MQVLPPTWGGDRDQPDLPRGKRGTEEGKGPPSKKRAARPDRQIKQGHSTATDAASQPSSPRDALRHWEPPRPSIFYFLYQHAKLGVKFNYFLTALLLQQAMPEPMQKGSPIPAEPSITTRQRWDRQTSSPRRGSQRQRLHQHHSQREDKTVPHHSA